MAHLKKVIVLSLLGLSTFFFFQNCGKFKANELFNEKSSESDVNKNPVIPAPAEDVLWNVDPSRTFLTLSPDSLTVTKDDGAGQGARAVYATILKNSGIWYFEVKVSSLLSGAGLTIGVASEGGRVADNGAIATAAYGLKMSGDFLAFESGAEVDSVATGPLVANDVVGVLLDLNKATPLENFEVNFFVNGVFVMSQALPDGLKYSPFVYGGNDDNGSFIANFGSQAFAFPPNAFVFQPLQQ